MASVVQNSMVGHYMIANTSFALLVTPNKLSRAAATLFLKAYW